MVHGVSCVVRYSSPANDGGQPHSDNLSFEIKAAPFHRVAQPMEE